MGIVEKDGAADKPACVVVGEADAVARHLVDQAGQVAWDWWNYNNIYDVDSRPNQHADLQVLHRLRRQYGLQYIILDEGWYNLETCWKSLRK